jgi:hypothetical protein
MDKGDKMTPKQKEELRIVLLTFLTARHPLAFNAESIRATLVRRGILDFPFSDQDVESALAVLQDLQLVAGNVESLGSTTHWSATAQGLIEVERKGYL